MMSISTVITCIQTSLLLLTILNDGNARTILTIGLRVTVKSFYRPTASTGIVLVVNLICDSPFDLL